MFYFSWSGVVALLLFFPLQTSGFTASTAEKGVASVIPSQGDLPSEETAKNVQPHLIFPGGGIYFYWQAGAVTYLREKGYDLDSATMSGASAGALTATLSATNVDFYQATDLALGMAKDAGVWDRSGGLQGIWGPMIQDWLDQLLPHDAVDQVHGRLSLLVTPVPSFGKEQIQHFANKNDLINCNMASVHLPWFLDGKLTSSFRDRPHIDGSFLSKAKDYIPRQHQQQQQNGDRPSSKRKLVTLDWSKDPVYKNTGGVDVVKALSPDGIWGLLEQGKSFASQMEERGDFQCLKKK